MHVRSAQVHSGKDTGLTLIQTMILVMVLGLLLTWAVSLWLDRSETEVPATPNSSSCDLGAEQWMNA